MGIPERPDATIGGRALGPAVRARPELEHFDPGRRIPEGPFRLEHGSPRRQLASASRFEASPNWAGAYITANEGLRFAQLYGFWKVPLKSGSGAAGQFPPSDPALPYKVAAWIGLDGQRDYVNSSLPQIGTKATSTRCRASQRTGRGSSGGRNTIR